MEIFLVLVGSEVGSGECFVAKTVILFGKILENDNVRNWNYFKGCIGDRRDEYAWSDASKYLFTMRYWRFIETSPQ